MRGQRQNTENGSVKGPENLRFKQCPSVHVGDAITTTSQSDENVGDDRGMKFFFEGCVMGVKMGVCHRDEFVPVTHPMKYNFKGVDTLMKALKKLHAAKWHYWHSIAGWSQHQEMLGS